MATRPPRLKRPHTHFHVTSRGGNRWNVFLDDLDKRRFLFLLSLVCKRYGIEIHAFCLMGNHFHLLPYCPSPVLSAAMRDLKSRYAKYFNARHNGSGPVFEAPFVEVPILDDEHLMVEIRYIHRNPLDLDPTACLATAPWSSHGIYLGLRPKPLWMQTRVGLELFGPSYRHNVETPRDSDKVQNTVRPIVDSPGASTIGHGAECSLAAIRQEVATAAGCELIDVRTRSHNGLIGVAVLVALDVGFSAAEIAEPFGFNSKGALHMAAKRARERLVSDPEVSLVHDQVQRRLRPAA